ncbi:MAG: hypothetical protein H0W72_00870 [Planctomycetes bacterium]|nr:hypothetical protein [Planctomycetota bacterium]
MTPRRFAIAVAVCLAVLLAFNAAVWSASRSTQRQQALGQARAAGSAHALFFGNSLMAGGCDPEAFAASWRASTGTGIAAMNLALGQSGPVEHWLLAKTAFAAQPRPRLVVYGFFDTQLTDPCRGGWGDLTGNRALAYSFPGEAARFYGDGSTVAHAWYATVGAIPLLSERWSLWSRVESGRRRLEALGMPPRADNRFGRAGDFAAFNQDAEGMHARCRGVVTGDGSFSPPIAELLRGARSTGARTVLVAMPMPERHRRGFYAQDAWSSYAAWIRDQAALAGGEVVDASDWLTDDAFVDDVHLGDPGSAAFCTKLAEVLSVP